MPVNISECMNMPMGVKKVNTFIYIHLMLLKLISPFFYSHIRLELDLHNVQVQLW